MKNTIIALLVCLFFPAFFSCKQDEQKSLELSNQAKQLFEKNKKDEAEKLYEKTVKTDSKNTAAIEKLVSIAKEKKDAGKLEKLYRQLISADSSNDKARMEPAGILDRNGYKKEEYLGVGKVSV